MTKADSDVSGPKFNPRPLVLAVLASLAACCVWSVHRAAPTASIFIFALGGGFAVAAGGLVGVPLISSIAAFIGFTGLLEGAYRGWLRWSYIGAVAGGLAGIVMGVLAAMVPLMSIHLVLLSLGVDPVGSEDATKSGDP